MKQSSPKWIRVSLLVLSISLLILLPSCDQEIDTPTTPSDTITPQVLELGTRTTEITSFLETYILDEDELHGTILDFAIGYNRVASLVNSVLYADLESTDRATMKKRVQAAIAELDAFDAICKELETLGKSWDEALDTASSTASKSVTRAETGDEWYARRLVEIMVDPDTQVRFNLEDISRKTGVGMKKLLYLMNQTNEQYKTNIDIVDEEEYEKEMHYLETVRDTAGNINATLALATPLGAFGAGAAATAVGTAAGTSATTAVTTTAANAVGWINNAKKAYTVVENASAVISFTNGVVNLAVDQEDIPPTFRNVAEVNGYLGILVGGIGGFTGSKTADKLVAVVGTGPDLVTKYVAYKDGQVVVSDAPSLGTTPVGFETSGEEALVGVLPEGDYRIPDSIEDWDFPDFDWGDESEWESLYDEGLFVTDSFLTDLEGRFLDLLDTWIPKGAITEVNIDSDDEDGMPDFLDDIEDLAVAPEDSDFSVELYASAKAGIVPFSVTFTVVPNEAFLFGQTDFRWDFGDGDIVELTPGDAGYGSTITHEYTEDPIDSSFTASVTATDVRGYYATKEITISISETLQQIIDSFPEGSTITIPAGTYSGPITLHRGKHLIGAGAEYTIIEGGPVVLEQNTTLQGVTVRGTPSGGGIRNSFEADKWAKEDAIDIDIIDVIVEDTPNTTPGIYINDRWTDTSTDEAEMLDYVGTISGTIVKNNLSSAVEISYGFTGAFRDNLLENNVSGVYIGEVKPSAIFTNNSIRNSEGIGLAINKLSGSIVENVIEGNAGGIYIESVELGASIKENTIQNNKSISGLYLLNMNGGEIRGNTITGNTNSSLRDGGGIYIGTVFSDADVVNNTISSNSAVNRDGGGVYIARLSGAFTNNTVTSNHTNLDGVGLFEGGGVYVSIIEAGSEFQGNTISSNEGTSNGGGCFIASGPETLGYSIKSTNTIIENNLSGGSVSAKKDLYTPWRDDRLPEDTE